MKKFVLWGIFFGVVYFASQKLLVLPVAKEGECFNKHFLESIQLNQTRKPLYLRRSASASNGISSRIVWMEKAALMLGNFSKKYRFDERDAVYRQANMSIVCESLVPISKTPEFKDSYSDGVAPLATSYTLFSATTARDDLQIALNKGGYVGLKEEALARARGVGTLKTNCLVRHVLRSIARTASLAPNQIALATEKGLPGPDLLIRDLISFQLLALSFGNWLDESALKVQEKGIPILCQDLPEVPVL